MRLKDYAKQKGITYRTAQNHWYKGLLKGEQLATGTIVIFEENSFAVKNKPLQVATYARVSSTENKDNLDTQQFRLINYANAKGYKTTFNVKEIGSGLNDSRPKLIQLLSDNDIDIILVEHKDRLTRFGFKYIETLLELNGRKIEVINNIDDDKDDLIQDFISIITSFCARIYGQRRCKRQKK